MCPRFGRLLYYQPEYFACRGVLLVCMATEHNYFLTLTVSHVLQGRRKAFKSEGALALAFGQSPLGGFGGMLPRKILRFDIVRDRI